MTESLTKENPERYSGDLAACYNNAGGFYKCQGNHSKAEEHFLRAIEIRERLAKENPERYSGDLAASYNSAGDFYDEQGNPAKTEEYYLKAIETYEKLTKENPARYNPDLAVSYFYFANFKKDNTFFEKALEFARTVPEHPQCMQIIEMADEWYENTGARKKKPWYKRINSLFKK